MSKHALNRRPIQFVLSGLIIGSTIIAIVSPTAFQSTLGANAASYVMLTLFATGLFFFARDHRSLMMLSFSACAALCLILKEDQSKSQLLSEFQDQRALNIALFEPSNEKTDSCNLLEIMEANHADGIIISSINEYRARKLSKNLQKNGYHYFFQAGHSAQSGIAYFYKANLQHEIRIYGNLGFNNSPEKKLIKNTRIYPPKEYVLDPLNSFLELKNYNFVGQLDCNCSFSAQHRGSILIYELNANAKKTS